MADAVTPDYGIDRHAPVAPNDGHCGADWADDVACFTETMERGYVVETVTF